MGSGLHNKVKELIKNNGSCTCSLCEEINLDLWKQIKIAYQYFCECHYVPNTYYKHSGIDFVKEMDKKFRKNPYMYFVNMKTYLKQQIKHYERLYLAYRITRYMIEEWEIDDIEYFGENVLDKNWIKKYNESLEEIKG